MNQNSCRHCGKSIKDDSLFCEFCGRPVSNENTANNSAPLYPKTELSSAPIYPKTELPSVTPLNRKNFYSSSQAPGGGGKLNSYALWSFILSIINLGSFPIGMLVLWPCCLSGLILFIMSLIFAIKGRSDIALSEGKERGAGFALWGIILSILPVFLTIIFYALMALGYYTYKVCQ